MGFLKNLIGRFKFGGGRANKRAGIISIKTSTEILGDPPWAGGAGTFAFSDADEGDAAMKASVWVFACTRLIATSMSSIKLKVFVGDEEAPEDHALVALLNQPMPGVAQSQWMALLSQYLTTGGEVYFEKTRAEAIGLSATDPKRGLTSELWAHPGSMFEPIVPPDVRRNVPTGYKPKVGDKDEVAPEDIIHVRRPRPSDINSGFGPVEGSEGEINTDSQASGWQQSALGNRGVPDGIFVYSGEDGLSLTEEQEVEQQIDDRWTGIKNAHKPFVLGKDLAWVDLAKTMVELELIPGRIFTKSGICAAMIVPTVLFDAAAATYANLAAALSQLQTLNILPTAKLIVDALNISLAPEYGDDVTIKVDPGKSMAMLPMVQNQWDIVAKAVSTGVPVNQLIESVGLDVEPYAGSDIGWIPAGQQPVDIFNLSGLSDTPDDQTPGTRSTLAQVRKRLRDG